MDTTEVRAELVEEAKTASEEEQLAAIKHQTRLIRQAHRDQLTANQRIHNDIARVNDTISEKEKALKEEEARIFEVKKKVLMSKVAVSQQNPSVPLPELKDTAGKVVDELKAQSTNSIAAEEALVRLLAYKEIVQADLKKQLDRGERLTKELRGTKKKIQLRSRRNREMTSANADTRHEIKKIRQSMSDTKSHAKSIDRHNDRLERTLKQYDKEFKTLQKDKVQSKQLVLDEVRLAEERDQWIENLRTENSQITALLLKKYGEEALEIPADVVEEAAEVEEGFQKVAPKVVPRPAMKNEGEAAVEDDLLQQYDATLKATMDTLKKSKP